MTCLPRMIEDGTFPAPCWKAGPLARSNPGVLPVIGFAGVGIVIAVVERLHIRKHRLRQPAALHFIVGQRSFEDIGELGQGGAAIQARKLSSPVDDLATYDHL